jgi:hypothetical protein
MPITSMASATTLKMIADPKMLSCKYTGRYTGGHMLTGTAGYLTYALCKCFLNRAEWKGKIVPRFTRIVDPELIAQLQAIKARMYPNT